MQPLVTGMAVLGWVTAARFALIQARNAGRFTEQLEELGGRLDPGGPEPSVVRHDVATALARVDRALAASVDRSADSEQRAAALVGVLEEISLGVILTGPDGEVLFRNESAVALVGTRPADALASGAVSELLAGASAGQPGNRSLELYGPPRRTLALSGIPLADGAAAVIIEDVSDRRRLDAVRRDFVANVSHELKTPVAALGLLAETLAAEPDLEVVRRLGGRMQQEAFRVNRIIEDLLDLSRLEGEATARYETVPVHTLVTEAVERVQPAASGRDVHISVREVPRSWSVLGDQRQLVSALANLLENAVKYSEDGSAVELRADTDGASVGLVVEDHGVGIPSRDLDRIFERFYRVDRGRGRDTGGTGLGLSIVRHVAVNHGGEVRVASVEGQGSAFTLRLPAAPGPMGLVAEAG